VSENALGGEREDIATPMMCVLMNMAVT
jgi:hypothetical protein